MLYQLSYSRETDGVIARSRPVRKDVVFELLSVRGRESNLCAALATEDLAGSNSRTVTPFIAAKPGTF
jgi:hypothetical protein